MPLPLSFPVLRHLGLAALPLVAPAASTSTGDHSQQPRRVALVFDDGPVPQQSIALLELLAGEDVRATFAYLGNRVEAAPELARSARAGGHEIVNHSFTHARFSELSVQAIQDEVARTSAAIEGATHEAPRWLWPPYAEWNEHLSAAVAPTGLPRFPRDAFHIIKSHDSDNTVDAAAIRRNATTNVRDQSIIIFHEWRKETLEEMPAIITELKRQHCTFLTLSELEETLDPLQSSSLERRPQPPALHVHPLNPRWIADKNGQALFLTGSHTWATVQERGLAETPPFDYPSWLDFLSRHGHNFLRIWVWEHASWMQFSDRMVQYRPTLYERTGPGLALDGSPRFDLTRLNQAYFDRLRERVLQANARGIHVAVMLFQGFSLDKTGGDPTLHNAYRGHPYNTANNINGLDGDTEGSGTGRQVHTLENPDVLRVQQEYVRKMVDTLNDIDGLIWEIGNELHADSVPFQYYWINFIRAYEQTKPKQHLIGMSGAHVTNEQLFASPADWIAPDKGDGYNDDIPPADGRKVIIIDTDHINWLGARNDPTLPWRALLRGNSFIYMDTYRDVRFGSPPKPDPAEDEIRRQMGRAAAFSQMLALARMVPSREIASSGHCLVEPGRAYAAFAPAGEPMTLDLTEASGQRFQVIWFDCLSGETLAGDDVVGGAVTTFKNPFSWHAAILLKAVDR